MFEQKCESRTGSGRRRDLSPDPQGEVLPGLGGHFPWGPRTLYIGIKPSSEHIGGYTWLWRSDISYHFFFLASYILLTVAFFVYRCMISSPSAWLDLNAL